MLDACRNLMGKKVAIILLLILIVGGVSAYFLFSRQATYTLYGTEIITTTAILLPLAASPSSMIRMAIIV